MNTFYKLKLSRITIREMWWGTKSPLILLGLPLKLLPMCVDSTADDPAVETLTPFEVPYSQLPSNVYGEMYPLLQELAACGFYWPTFHAISGFSETTRIYFATLMHAHGKAVARIHVRVLSTAHKTTERVFVTFFSEFSDGTFVVTSSGRPDLDTPKTQTVRHIVNASCAQLGSAQADAVAAASMQRHLQLVDTPEKVRAVNERYHAQLRDYHVARGVFVPMPQEEQSRAEDVLQTARAAGTAGLAHGDVLAEVHALQNKKGGWKSALIILIVSVLLFIGGGAQQWDWKTLWLIIPVLFIHELGHYLAMRLFRYRNLRMFFIPFFGAAVTGQNYNVAGWKKAIVSLMGPVPGILLGCGLGVLGMILHQPLLNQAAIMLLIINGMNLLPVLPLDGGWILHTVLFSRHPLLDAAFRVLALGGLIALAIFGQARMLAFIAIPMILGLPLSYKLARITADLRRKGVGAASSDAQTLAPETAQAIVQEVKREFPTTHTKSVAQYTLNIFETLNARPPGVAASLGLLAVHGGSLILALGFGIAFVMAQQGDIGKFIRAAAFQPEHGLICTDLKAAGGKDALTTTGAWNTLIATFPDHAQAEDSFKAAQPRLPDQAMLRLFGDSVLLSLPARDDAARREWFDRFSDQTTNTLVDSTNRHVSLTLMCLAPTVEAAQLLEEELTGYFQPGPGLRLIPPWQPGDTRSEGERTQHDKARRTYVKLRESSYGFYKSTEWQATQTRMLRAQCQGDTQEMNKIQGEQRALTQRLVEEDREKIRRGGAEQVDLPLIDLYAALPQPSATDFEAHRMSLAPRLGQLRGDDKKNADAFAAQSGTASRASLLLTFHGLTFAQPGDGLPALVEWLCAKGCVDFKYGFNQGFDDIDPGDLAEE